jgi:hypothetical protein
MVLGLFIKMVKTKLEKLGVMSVAKFGGIYGALIGLIGEILIAVMSSIFLGGIYGSVVPGAYSIIYGWGAIIWAPLFYGMIGFIGGIIGAFLFNIIAKMAGGIEMHFIEM